ncbi:unnamed protein product [Echinostoma caproni]|uniref:t-SNARE coiled-coil homology domain-containing protein n=1 Tax=Echinostoma caproni TaxID=27848 RepID=A0A183AQ81_9TREM|nr:unnamed protein product [Echinostoma caproni]
MLSNTDKEKDAIALIKLTGNQFADLASYTTLDHTAKIQAQLLKGDFQRALQRFQRTQAEIKRRLITETQATESSAGDLIQFGDQGQSDNALLFQSGATQIHAQAQKGDAQQLGLALQQEAEMQALEEDIVNVNIIFEQLMSLVYDQRTAVESIEDNIEAAYINQEAGTSSLAKAATSRQRSRRRRCICCIVLFVAIGITALVLVLVYAPRSNGK